MAIAVEITNPIGLAGFKKTKVTGTYHLIRDEFPDGIGVAFEFECSGSIGYKDMYDYFVVKMKKWPIDNPIIDFYYYPRIGWFFPSEDVYIMNIKPNNLSYLPLRMMI